MPPMPGQREQSHGPSFQSPQKPAVFGGATTVSSSGSKSTSSSSGKVSFVGGPKVGRRLKGPLRTLEDPEVPIRLAEVARRLSQVVGEPLDLLARFKNADTDEEGSEKEGATAKESTSVPGREKGEVPEGAATASGVDGSGGAPGGIGVERGVRNEVRGPVRWAGEGFALAAVSPPVKDVVVEGGVPLSAPAHAPLEKALKAVEPAEGAHTTGRASSQEPVAGVSQGKGHETGDEVAAQARAKAALRKERLRAGREARGLAPMGDSEPTTPVGNEQKDSSGRVTGGVQQESARSSENVELAMTPPKPEAAKEEAAAEDEASPEKAIEGLVVTARKSGARVSVVRNSQGIPVGALTAMRGGGGKAKKRWTKWLSCGSVSTVERAEQDDLEARQRKLSLDSQNTITPTRLSRDVSRTGTIPEEVEYRTPPKSPGRLEYGGPLTPPKSPQRPGFVTSFDEPAAIIGCYPKKRETQPLKDESESSFAPTAAGSSWMSQEWGPDATKALADSLGKPIEPVEEAAAKSPTPVIGGGVGQSSPARWRARGQESRPLQAGTELAEAAVDDEAETSSLPPPQFSDSPVRALNTVRAGAADAGKLFTPRSSGGARSESGEATYGGVVSLGKAVMHSPQGWPVKDMPRLPTPIGSPPGIGDSDVMDSLAGGELHRSNSGPAALMRTSTLSEHAEGYMFGFNDPAHSTHVLRLVDGDLHSTALSGAEKALVKSGQSGGWKYVVPEVHVNSLVLAAECEFFYKLLNTPGLKHDYTEDGKPILEVSTADPSLMVEMLKYVYRRRLSPLLLRRPKRLLHLLLAADKYGVPSCARDCAARLLQYQPMNLADATYCLSLPEDVQQHEYVADVLACARHTVLTTFEDLDATWLTQDFMTLPLLAVQLILSNDQTRVKSENTVLFAVMAWAQLSFPRARLRHDAILCLLPCIRFPAMSAEFILDVLARIPELQQSEKGRDVVREAMRTKMLQLKTTFVPGSVSASTCASLQAAALVRPGAREPGECGVVDWLIPQAEVMGLQPGDVDTICKRFFMDGYWFRLVLFRDSKDCGQDDIYVMFAVDSHANYLADLEGGVVSLKVRLSVGVEGQVLAKEWEESYVVGQSVWDLRMPSPPHMWQPGSEKETWQDLEGMEFFQDGGLPVRLELMLLT